MSFRGPRAFLSNFHPVQIYLECEAYPTVENAYQAAKTLDEGMRKRIAAVSPTEAKQLGRGLEAQRPGWLARVDQEPLRVEYMRYFIWYKFAMYEDLRQQLLATGTEPLEAHNEHGDAFWGLVNGRGENMLGRLLMATRAQLSSAPRHPRSKDSAIVQPAVVPSTAKPRVVFKAPVPPARKGFKL